MYLRDLRAIWNGIRSSVFDPWPSFAFGCGQRPRWASANSAFNSDVNHQNAESAETKNRMKEKHTSEKVIGCAIEVRPQLGPGLMTAINFLCGPLRLCELCV